MKGREKKEVVNVAGCYQEKQWEKYVDSSSKKDTSNLGESSLSRTGREEVESPWQTRFQDESLVSWKIGMTQQV